MGRPLAVVTGASSGIGAAFARKLAREGHDLLLVARREDRLRALATELATLGARSEVMVCDLADPLQREALCADLRTRTGLGALVHNAGFGVTGAVGVADAKRLEDMAQVHVNATIALTSAVAPGMRAARSGRVVVVSSIAGWLFGAGSATYCATKAFETSYTRSLARELKPFGVRTLALCPGYTRTEFHDTPEYADWNRGTVPSWMWDTPESVVSHAWKALERGKALCVPGLVNKLVVFSMATGVLGVVRERIRRRGPKL
jgi:short-subunit dehydrogenase